jgi:hypothetical protein
MEHRAALQRKDAVGKRQHQIEIVLDNDDAHVPAQPVEYTKEFQGHRRREPFERLVQQQQLDIARHRARHGDHLLLPAGEIVGRDVHALLQAREIVKDLLLIPHDAVAAVGLARKPPEREIFAHGEAREQAAALRDIADAHARDIRGGEMSRPS